MMLCTNKLQCNNNPEVSLTSVCEVTLEVDLYVRSSTLLQGLLQFIVI